MKRFVLAAIFAVSLGSGAAFAADPQPQPAEAREASVRYADLDLTKTEDALTLMSRLRTASARVCSVEELDRPGPAARRAMEECREAAVEEAVATLDAPALTRIHIAGR